MRTVPRVRSLPSILKLFLNVFFLFSSPAFADYTLNMTRGVTEISRGVYQLHMTIFWICVAVGLIVFSVMFYAIIWHRKSRGVQAAHFHESTLVEVIWTLIPFAILIGMAIPATKMLIKMGDTETDSDYSIKVTGYQWRWEYEYLGEGVRFISNTITSQDQIKNRDVKNQHYLLEVDKPLVLPIGKKIRFLTTANDVVHSWWVPALGFKKDAIPGFINEAWARIETPGIYRGQCAELCGVNHGFMPIVVVAKPEAEFKVWLAEQKLAAQKAENAVTNTASPPTSEQPVQPAEPAQPVIKLSPPPESPKTQKTSPKNDSATQSMPNNQEKK